MLKIIRNLLEKIIEDIDAGNSNLSEEEALEAIKMLTEYTRKDEGISKYEACLYMNMSRATFDRQIESGILPKGKHVKGFKELRWYKKDLDLSIKQVSNKL